MAKNPLKFRKFWIAMIPVVLIVIIVILEVTNTTHIFHKAAKVSAPGKPITHLNNSTTQNQSNTNSGTEKNPSTNNTSVAQGQAADNKGQTPAGVSTDPSQWSTSSSRLITLKSPLQNATLKPGDPIYGSAASGPVQYRLIDDQVGIIAQGTISVVNGNFSATVNFQSQSSTGRLDVFNTDSSGRETNEVQITLKF